MAEKVRADVSSYFTFSSGGDDVIVFPLRGHIVEIDYPESARDWAGTDLDALVDLEPIRLESPPALHDALRGLADSIDEVVLATDSDREGELIGVRVRTAGGLRRSRPDADFASRGGSRTGPPRLRAPTLLERRAYRGRAGVRSVRGGRTLLGRRRRAVARGPGGTRGHRHRRAYR